MSRLTLLVRVTRCSYLKEDVLMEYLRSKKHVVFGVEEYPHENPHYHFWIETDLKHNTVQKFLANECFTEADNKSRLFSVKKADGNLKYLCKGPLAVSDMKASDFPGKRLKPVVVMNTMGVSDEEILKSHEDWWIQAEDIKLSSVKREKSKQKSKESWFLTLIEDAKERGCTHASSGWELGVSIYKSYGSRLKVHPNQFQIRCYAESMQRHFYMKLQEENGGDVYERYLRALTKSAIGSVWIEDGSF